MVQVIVEGGLLGKEATCLELCRGCSCEALFEHISGLTDIPSCDLVLRSLGGVEVLRALTLDQQGFFSRNDNINDNNQEEDSVLVLQCGLSLVGGIDFQHREGGKTGSGGQLSESQAALERKERLRRLALETIDITKDPYFFKNHLGTFECKLCLTMHPNEGNYLAHTQGKRHQYNVGRRAAMEAKNATPKVLEMDDNRPMATKRSLKIGRPGYRVTKSRDLHTRQRSIAFELDFPESEEGAQPRHRFMSTFEQKVEPADKNYQYVLFACEPYETVAFKIPNLPVDKREGRFFTNWDKESKKFVLQLFFVDGAVSVAPPPQH
jgi:splicing factor 3A subunit 2